jgi:imidazolonepropionase-like amidohydrolase
MLSMELMWMAEAGLSALQAIVAATANAARAFGWHQWHETLEEGKVADLIVVSGNPLEDLHVLTDRRKIELVIKDGEVVVQQYPSAESAIPESLMAGAWLCCGLPH